jgi:hemerythrin
MALFNWSDKYSVEVQSIDKQHQKLFAMMNELHEAMASGKGNQLAPAIVKRLVNYTRDHLAAEEGMMRRANYPDFNTHKAEHDELNRKVAKMAKDIEGGNVVLSINLQNFLREWLKTHILLRDKQYSAHLRTAGVR